MVAATSVGGVAAQEQAHGAAHLRLDPLVRGQRLAHVGVLRQAGIAEMDELPRRQPGVRDHQLPLVDRAIEQRRQRRGALLRAGVHEDPAQCRCPVGFADQRADDAAGVLRQHRTQEADAELVQRIGQRHVGIEDEVAGADRLALAADHLGKQRRLVGEARVAEADAALQAARTALDLTVVRAPIAGTVLQVSARPGQFAGTGAGAEPLLRFGQTAPLHVRIDIDEADIARVDPAAAGEIVARGAFGQRASIRRVRVEPLVIPKRSLTNQPAERVDTRVLQVIYALPAEQAADFVVGQQVDAYLPAIGP